MTNNTMVAVGLVVIIVAMAFLYFEVNEYTEVYKKLQKDFDDAGCMAFINGSKFGVGYIPNLSSDGGNFVWVK